jgi:glycosyltransferase involved in cell wall biosynthesis
MAMRIPNITFLGAVSRPQLVQEQLKADLLTFPCNYDELYCYAVVESGIAGAFPITTPIAALNTTNLGVFATREQFADTVIKTLLLPREELAKLQKAVRGASFIRFSPERILKEWDTKVFGL